MKFSRGGSLIAMTLGLCAAAFAQGVERRDGFIPMLWDGDQGKLLLEIPQLDKDILYFTSIAKGSGSGSVGFEWAGGGEGGVIQFQRVGPKVLVVEKNTSFRAGSGGPGMEKGVDASFPDSVLGSLPIVKSEGGKVTVDATSFFVRDAVGFAETRGGRGGGGGGRGERAQGTQWQFDASRSAIYLPRTKGFPKNTEVEVTVTYRATSGGARTTPESSILTGRLHYSFLDPPTGYKTREADPRIGVGGVTFADYSTPNSEGKMIELIRRHRLEKKNPNAAMSDPKEPIVYYLDAAVPEPIRGAMKEGFLWWNKAFEAAGFTNALVIKDAPLDMDPMDVRYNQLYWVDRDERGFSTGGGLTDPRTGEIIAARVRLESDRVRTASSYWEAYKPGATGADNHFFAPPAYSTPDTEVQMAQLREALLTAHETGHSLGFGHNWDSSMNNRASVMEYPSPRLKVINGKIDVTDSWQKEIGAYDISMVRYAYSEFPAAKEKEGLEGVIQDMRKQGLIFTPSSDPRWNRYDELDDPAEYLRQTIAQRKILVANYGEGTLLPGESYGDLRGMRMWMTYLHHRWAIDSGVRYIGGIYLNYVMKGEKIPPTEIVPAAKQREILGLLLSTLDPSSLAMPESLLKLLTVETASRPRNAGGGADLENLDGNLGAAFDHLAAAKTVAGLVLDQIFEPETANKLIAFADRQQNALTLPELIETVNKTVWVSGGEGMNKSIQRGTQRVYLDALMTLGANNNATPDVKAVVMMEMGNIKTTLAGMKDSDPVTEAHLRQLERDATRYLNNPTAPRRTTPDPPTMAPI